MNRKYSQEFKQGAVDQARWYAIEVNPGHEDAVKRRIETAVMARNYQHMIKKVEIPERINDETFSNCVMANRSWGVIRGIEGVKQHRQLLEKGKYYRSSEDRKYSYIFRRRPMYGDC